MPNHVKIYRKDFQVDYGYYGQTNHFSIHIQVLFTINTRQTQKCFIVRNLHLWISIVEPSRTTLEKIYALSITYNYGGFK